MNRRASFSPRAPWVISAKNEIPGEKPRCLLIRLRSAETGTGFTADMRPLTTPETAGIFVDQTPITIALIWMYLIRDFE